MVLTLPAVILSLLLVATQVLEVNKQWDIQWNSMKQQFEQKVSHQIQTHTNTDAHTHIQ